MPRASFTDDGPQPVRQAPSATVRSPQAAVVAFGGPRLSAADDLSRHSGCDSDGMVGRQPCVASADLYCSAPGTGLARARERVGAGTVGSWRLLVSRRHLGVGSTPWLRDRIGVRR